MARPEAYRKAALDCIALADAATDARSRMTLLKMAQMWAKLADQAVKNARAEYRDLTDRGRRDDHIEQ